jgi:hypothetical protein
MQKAPPTDVSNAFAQSQFMNRWKSTARRYSEP